jgi:hypothetical protein
VAGVYQAMIAAYLLGGIWGVLAFRYSARRIGLRSNRGRFTLAALAFFLWPLILLQMIFISIHAYQRDRIRRLRGKCG